MEKITFQEQYDKIVNAYYRDELEPFSTCACFIGNLLNNNGDWCRVRNFKDNGNSNITELFWRKLDGEKIIKENSNNLYTAEDIINLENNFLKVLNYSGKSDLINPRIYTEENLFKAMESTLIMLKEIHEKHGEVIPSYDFKKRELVKD